jgi:hypothetical protein
VEPAVLPVEAELDEPDVALARMKPPAVVVAAPVVPLFPVAPEVGELSRWTQPVTVT